MPQPSDSSDDDLDSRADTFTDQSSIRQQSRQPQKPVQGIRRNQPTTESTRRKSFAQKYGLNTPDNGSDHSLSQGGRRLSDPFDEEDEEEDSDDDQPLHMISNQQPAYRQSYQQQQSPYRNTAPQQQSPMVTTMRGAVGLARPISVCNIAQATSPARPPGFVKPATQMAARQEDIPPDMRQVHRLSEHFNHKVYIEGYLLKMNALNTDGRQYNDQRWAQHYVELCGPVLTLWNAETEASSNPEYINITDSYVNLMEQEGQFVLNSAGANRYIFQISDDSSSAQTWVLAIRLACFEGARIHEFYTRRFVCSSRHTDVVSKRAPKVEGWLQVRFPGHTGWKKYWTVVTDRRTEKKLIFSKKSVRTRGQLMFYESKKAKFPVKMIVNVVQAYTIYPESPKLIDLATMMKVEGNIYDCNNTNGEQKLFRDAASTLIMASNAKELTQWLVGTFDTFGLYGRPTKILDDPMDTHALNFGEPRGNGDLPRLFLEVHEASSVKVNQGETLLDNKLALAGLLEQKMRQYQSPTTPSVPPPNTAGIMGFTRTNSMPLISGIPAASSSNNNSTYGSEDGHVQRRPTSSMANTLPTTHPNRHSAPLLQQMGSPSQPQQQPAVQQQQYNPNNRSSVMSPVAAGRSRQSIPLVYASDDSEEDDDDDEEEEDDTSSTSSTLQKTNTMTQPTTTKPSPLPRQETMKIEVPTSPIAPLTTLNTIPVATPTPSQPSHVTAVLTPSSESESDREPLPQTKTYMHKQRRPSEMTLPEISESTDFMSSILGDMSLHDHNNNINRGPPPPPPAHVTPMASTSTPILNQQQQQRDIAKYSNNRNEKHISISNTDSDDSSTTSSHSSGKKAETVSPVSPPTPQQQQMGNKSSRPSSAMGWRRSSSNLLMQPSSSGSSSVRSMTPSGSETSSMGQQHQNATQQRQQRHRGSVQYSQQLQQQQQQQQRRSMYMNDHGGRRSSSAILLQQHWETPEEDEHEDEQYHHHSQQQYPMGGMVSPQQQRQYPMYQQQQQQQYDPYGYQQYQHYAEGHHDSDDDAPIIPQLGTNFVTQNSLLDMYQSDQLPARVQEEHARMSGQPLVSLPNKPPKPSAGLVGMISQLEHEKKERENVKGRIMEMEKERALEQERERFYFDQQQQQQRHSAMMQSTPPASSTPQPMMTPQQSPFGGNGMMMMDPRMSMPPVSTPPMMNPQMMMMPMMPPQPMMDPRMSMMPNMAMMYMMQGSYGQMAPSMPMFYNPMMMQAPEKVQDADDDVPLSSHHRQQRQRSNSHHF